VARAGAPARRGGVPQVQWGNPGGVRPPDNGHPERMCGRGALPALWLGAPGALRGRWGALHGPSASSGSQGPDRQ